MLESNDLDAIGANPRLTLKQAEGISPATAQSMNWEIVKKLHILV
jgi:hypothetical protein